jgi:hypothetical protein
MYLVAQLSKIELIALPVTLSAGLAQGAGSQRDQIFKDTSRAVRM